MKKGFWGKIENSKLHYYEESNSIKFTLCAKANAVIVQAASPWEAQTSTNKCKICQKILEIERAADKKKETPNPGSPEAIKQNCLCAILDNAHGKGCGYKDDDGNPLFWITESCPLHGGKMKPSEILTQAYNDFSFTPEDRKQVVDSIIDSMAEDIYYIKKNALFSSEAVINPPKRREWENEKE